MNRKRPKIIVRWLLGVLILSLVAVSYSAWKGNRRLTQAEMLADWDYLLEIMHDNYPYFEVLERMWGYSWLDRSNIYRTRIGNSESDTHFISNLSYILSELKQGHTGVVDPSFYKLLLDTYSEAADEYNMHRWVEILQSPLVQERYSWWNRRTLSWPGRNTINNMPSGLQCSILEPDRVAYIRLQHILYNYIEEDGKRIAEFLSQTSSFPFLIIDIRGNPGGSDLYWQENIVAPLIKEPIEYVAYSAITGGEYAKSFISHDIYPAEQLPEGPDYPPEIGGRLSHFIEERMVINPSGALDFEGEIILLVDGGVFSSAATFAAFAKMTNWALVVGQPTKGDGLSIDSAIVSLPNSGLIVRFPTTMGLNPDGSSNFEKGTIPDMVVSGAEDSLTEVLKNLRQGD